MNSLDLFIDDLVELVSKNKCPECGYEDDTFIVHGIFKKNVAHQLK